MTQQSNENMNAQIACTYASLILYDDKLDINSDNLTKLLEAANINIPKYWTQIFSKAIEAIPIDKLLIGQCLPNKRNEKHLQTNQKENINQNNQTNEINISLNSPTPSPSPTLPQWLSSTDTESEYEESSDEESQN